MDVDHERDAVLAYLNDLWRELLRFDRVGPEDDFFALGGNSLLALQMLMTVSVKYGVEPDSARFLTDPTIRVLSDMILVQRHVIS